MRALTTDAHVLQYLHAVCCLWWFATVDSDTKPQHYNVQAHGTVLFNPQPAIESLDNGSSPQNI